MWYTVREKNKSVFFHENGLKLVTDAVTFFDGRIASLENGKCVIRDHCGRILHKKSFVTDHPNKIVAYGSQWIAADEDTGCVYLLSSSGALLTILKVGEHVSDLCVEGQNAYVTTYQDNAVMLLDDFKTKRIRTLPGMPTRVMVFVEKVFVLLQTGYKTEIIRSDEFLNEERRVSFPPQIGEMYIQNNRVFFCGNEQRMILNTDLKILLDQKSTGEILCRDASEAIFYRQKSYRCDPISGVLYPV